MSIFLSGGGLQMGQVIGATNPRGGASDRAGDGQQLSAGDDLSKIWHRHLARLSRQLRTSDYQSLPTENPSKSCCRSSRRRWVTAASTRPATLFVIRALVWNPAARPSCRYPSHPVDSFPSVDSRKEPLSRADLPNPSTQRSRWTLPGRRRTAEFPPCRWGCHPHRLYA